MRSAFIARALVAVLAALALMLRPKGTPITAGPVARAVSTESQHVAAPLVLPPQPAAIAASDNRGERLSGRVTTKKSGAPVPLARIELSPLVPSDQTAIVQADLEGRFRFGGLKPGKYTAIARADGLAPAAASWVEVPGADLDLRMTEGAFVEGHVVNADGSPAEGAELSSSPNESVLSVEHGAFSMQVSPGRPRLVVRGRHAAAVLQLPFVAPGTTLHNVVVRLAPGASISGVVVGGEPKAPAVGAAVSVTPAGTSEPIARQTSGAGGAFSFGALPPGIYDVSASAAARGRGNKRGLVVEQGAYSEVQLDLFPEAGVHGVVRDHEGKPVPGAIVKEAWGSQETVSGADGSYSLTGFTSDHVWLLAMRSRDEDGDSESIELPAGAEVERDIWVQRNGILTGSVRFASGQQLPADLHVHAMRTTPFFASRAVAIGSTGRYRLSLPPGSYQIAAVGDIVRPREAATGLGGGGHGDHFRCCGARSCW